MGAEEDTDELESETIGYFVHQGHQPTHVTLDQEILIRALSAAEEAKEYAHELLAIHDSSLGRTLKRHRMMAEQLEQSIQRSAQVEADLRRSMGWPLREQK